jgi:hypothetical protein
MVPRKPRFAAAVLLVLCGATAFLVLTGRHPSPTREAQAPPTPVFCDQSPDPETCFDRAFASANALTRLVFAPDSTPEGTLVRYLRWTIVLRNQEDRPVPRLDLWLHLPADLPGQTLAFAEFSHPAQTAKDSLGNRFARLAPGPLAPRETQVVETLVKVFRDVSPPAAPSPPLPRYSLPEPLIESGSPEIAKAARSLAGKTPLDTAQRVYEHVTATLGAGEYDPQDRGALWALTNKRGDCTEAALLFTALCRALAVPARTLTGYMAPRDRRVAQQDLHNWAEFYAEGRWHVADPYYRVFDANYSHYTAIGVFRKDAQTPLKGYHAFRFDTHGVSGAGTME